MNCAALFLVFGLKAPAVFAKCSGLIGLEKFKEIRPRLAFSASYPAWISQGFLSLGFRV